MVSGNRAEIEPRGGPGVGVDVKFHIGDVVTLKKRHPCGGFQWEVTRVGIDFKIKCLTCGRVVMLPRPKFEKIVKAVSSSGSSGAAQPGFGKTGSRLSSGSSDGNGAAQP